jgi:guanylate kinase
MAEAPFPGWPPARPFLLVVSGPSGVGKSVICRRLIDEDPSLVLSVSATTRSPRAQERDSVDYWFWSEPEFRAAVERGHFLEWAVVHGKLYGTPRAPLDAELARGRSPVLDVDVQGGRAVKAHVPDAVLILVAPPSLADLEQRLRGRGTDGEAAIRERLAIAAQELSEWTHYDYVVENDRLEDAVERIRSILVAERQSVARRRPRI